jgi:hypothetical protein
MRRAFGAYLVGRACMAANRGDYEVVLLTCDPQIELDIHESPISPLERTRSKRSAGIESPTTLDHLAKRPRIILAHQPGRDLCASLEAVLRVGKAYEGALLLLRTDDD